MANLPEDQLPSKFDVVVDGTGLVHSIVAAALVRAGKSVLHLDRNRYYGEHWASLMHRELEEWMSQSPLSEEERAPVTFDEDVIALGQPSGNTVSNISEVIPSTPIEQPVPNEQDPVPPNEGPSDQASGGSANEGPSDQASGGSTTPEATPNDVGSVTKDDVMTWDSLKTKWRRFSFDLMPKVMYCRGALVNLLTQSDCGRYVEFKAVESIYRVCEGSIEQVPCSRADLFSSQAVSIFEKRKMMKFLTFCADYTSQPDVYQDYSEASFGHFLSSRGLSEKVIDYIANSIAMVGKEVNTLAGLEATRIFLISLGRFGNAPFLYPIFGVGELGQAFCRLCAVFGGVYCLRRYIAGLVVKDDRVKGIVCSTTGQRIETETVISSAKLVRESLNITKNLREQSISRAVVVADGPLPGTNGKVTVITAAPLSTGPQQTFPVSIVQLDPGTSCSVPGTYLIHLMCTSKAPTAQADLESVLQRLLENEGGPRILWSLYYNISLCHVTGPVSVSPKGVYLTSDPDSTLNYEEAVKEAKRVFEEVCPGEEFLPTPPDPNDIIYEPSEEGQASPEEAALNQPATEQESGETPVPGTGDEVTSDPDVADQSTLTTATVDTQEDTATVDTATQEDTARANETDS